MEYIVFDLEWNQCPEGKQKEKSDLPFEIVEIGAIKLNERKEEIGRFHEYIRPSVYLRLHFRTREILRIDEKILKKADPFPAVAQRFREWCGDDVRYCIWGSADLLELQRNLRWHKLPNFFPFPLKYYDVQKIFSLAFEDGKIRRSLESAVDLLQIEKKIAFHEALSDAYYTAAVMARLSDRQLLPYFSIDYFRLPSTREEEIFEVFDTYAKFVSKKFPSKSSLLRDRVVLSTNCYLCRKRAARKIPWFSHGTRNLLSLSCCEKHGWMKGKLRIRKAEDGSGYFAVKTLKLLDAERAQEISDEYFRWKLHHKNK